MNRKASVVRLLALFAIPAAALPAGAQDVPRVETVLAADADFVVLIEDIGASRAKWSTSPWGALWRDPDMGALRDSVRTGLSESLGGDGEARLDEILDLLQGQVALAIDFEPPDTGGSPQVSWALVAGFRDGEALDALHAEIDRMRKDDAPQTREETVHGVSVRTRTTASGEEKESWAFADGIGLLGMPASYVKSRVAALKGKGEAPRLASSAGFRSMREQASGADVSCLLHVPGLSRFLTRAMETGIEENPNASMMGLTAEGVSRALALDSIEAAYLAWDEEETETVFHNGLLYHGDRGIVGLLAYLPGPCARPEFIPETAWMASSTRFSVAGMYMGFMGMMSDLNPGMAMMAKAQLEQLTMSHGLDLEADLLANLGENTFAAYLPASGAGVSAPDQIFGIEIKDPERIDAVLAAIYTAMGVTGDPVPVDRVGDTSIFALLPPESEQNIYYAVSGKHLILCRGAAEALAGILHGVRSPGPSIWNRPDVKASLDRLPENPCAIIYYDTASLLEMTFAAMEESEDGPEAGDMPDPDIIRRYFGAMVGGDYKTDEGILAVGYLQHAGR
jgi:hypothetical protein